VSRWGLPGLATPASCRERGAIIDAYKRSMETKSVLACLCEVCWSKGPSALWTLALSMTKDGIHGDSGSLYTLCSYMWPLADPL
jgi:hypothetical protein